MSKASWCMDPLLHGAIAQLDNQLLVQLAGLAASLGAKECEEAATEELLKRLDAKPSTERTSS